MLTTEPNTSSNVIGIADQMLDHVDAAAFLRASVGVPIEPLDLERHAKARTTGIPALGSQASLPA